MTTKILFGDDGRLIFDTYQRTYLRGYDVDFKNTPQSVIEAARQNLGKYDLIITDYSYEQDLNGLDVTSKIREFDSKTPIWLHSGEMDSELESRAIQAGANWAMPKSGSGRKLTEILKKLEVKGGNE